TVEHIIGRHMDERDISPRTSRGEIRRTVAIDREGFVRVALSLVDGSISGGVDDKSWTARFHHALHGALISDIQRGVSELLHGQAVAGGAALNLPAELSVGAGQENVAVHAV